MRGWVAASHDFAGCELAPWGLRPTHSRVSALLSSMGHNGLFGQGAPPTLRGGPQLPMPNPTTAHAYFLITCLRSLSPESEAGKGGPLFVMPSANGRNSGFDCRGAQAGCTALWCTSRLCGSRIGRARTKVCATWSKTGAQLTEWRGARNPRLRNKVNNVFGA